MSMLVDGFIWLISGRMIVIVLIFVNDIVVMLMKLWCWGLLVFLWNDFGDLLGGIMLLIVVIYFVLCMFLLLWVLWMCGYFLFLLCCIVFMEVLD